MSQTCNNCGAPLPGRKLGARGPLRTYCDGCKATRKRRQESRTPAQCRNPSCGKTFLARSRSAGYCSRECYHVATALPILSCEACGEPFKPGRGQRDLARFCSQVCANRANRPRQKYATRDEWLAAKREQWTANSAKRRAAVGDLVTEPVTLEEVAARDGYCCGICGDSVDMSLPGTDRMGPTRDHVVPLHPRSGEPQGDHCRSNIQLAHSICNGRKGNRQPEPWMLERVLLAEDTLLSA